MCVTIACMKGLQYVSWLLGSHEFWKIWNIISPIRSSFPIVSIILWEIELLDFGKEKLPSLIYFCYIDLWKTLSITLYLARPNSFLDAKAKWHKKHMQAGAKNKNIVNFQ